MRPGVWMIAVLLLVPAPAFAQFAAPFGSPGMFTAPETAGGLFGAGAASSAATQQQCSSNAVGRDGPRGNCVEKPASRDEHGR